MGVSDLMPPGRKDEKSKMGSTRPDPEGSADCSNGALAMDLRTYLEICETHWLDQEIYACCKMGQTILYDHDVVSGMGGIRDTTVLPRGRIIMAVRWLGSHCAT